MARNPDHAWAAGLLDAIGSFSVRREEDDSIPRVSIFLDDPMLPRRLKKIFGGTVNKLHYGKRKLYKWQVEGDEAVKCITSTLALLAIRKETARQTLYYSRYNKPWKPRWRRWIPFA